MLSPLLVNVVLDYFTRWGGSSWRRVVVDRGEERLSDRDCANDIWLLRDGIDSMKMMTEVLSDEASMIG